MAKGIREKTIRGHEYTPKLITDTLEDSQFSEKTKNFIKLVLIEGESCRFAGERYGVSRSLVHRRCITILQRAGINTSIAK